MTDAGHPRPSGNAGRIVIRADGGSEIGFGHLVRTGALAAAFAESGFEVLYATATPAATRSVLPSWVEIVALDGSPETNAWTIERIDALNADVLVVDSYAIDASGQEQLAECASVLGVVLDDARPVHADVVVNGNLYAPSLEYGWTGTEPSWCLGPAYLLLREAFRADRSRTSAPWRDPPERGLITFGGSDVGNATPRAIEAFESCSVFEDLTVTIGPGFENRSAIEAAARSSDHAIELLSDPDSHTLAAHMRNADLAVSALGSTIYELLASATSTIGIAQAPNQRPIAEALDQRNAAWVIASGADGDRMTSAIYEAIDGLLADTDRRRELYECGPTIVDGQGPRRVRDELISRIEHEEETT